MNVETLMDVALEDEFENLAKVSKGSTEHGKAVDSVTKLMDRKIEMTKIEIEAAQKEQQMKEDRKSRLYKNLIDVGGIVLPLAVTVWGAKASFKFEENGTITTAVGRKFIDKLMNLKR